jgi:hypothetical protein
MTTSLDRERAARTQVPFETFIDKTRAKVDTGCNALKRLSHFREHFDNEVYRDSSQRRRLALSCQGFILALEKLFGQDDERDTEVSHT